MARRLLTLPVVLLVLVLSGCASVPPPPVGDVSGQEPALRALDTWSITGRLNIRSATEARTINLRWQQQADAFDINLSSGMLGIGTVILSGDDDGVVMEQANEPPYRAPSLSDISIDWLGYDYPAQHLLYWVRGLPAPDLPYESTRDEAGLLITLKQGEWSLELERYQPVDDLYLPGRIRLDNGRFRLTFLINDWDLGR